MKLGKDIHVFRASIEKPCKDVIDKKVEYLLNFEKEMLKKYSMD